MKDKLEPNMYVRTKDGYIDKILKLNESYVKGVSQKDDFYAYDIDNIVKASYNITDILEIGDYVNEHRVEEIDFENEEIFTDSEYYCGVVEFCNIKSVITHEQMEQMAYKVVE